MYKLKFVPKEKCKVPNIKSAKKRVLVNKKKNDENRAYRSRMNNAIKKFNNAIDTLNLEEAEKLLPVTMSIIDQTVSAGIIHKNNAANKKSACAKRLSDVKSGKLVIVIKKDNKTIAAEKARVAQEAREAIRLEIQKKAAEKAAKKAEEKKEKAKADKKAAPKAEKPAKAEKAAKAEKPAKAEKAEKPAAKTTKAKKPAAEKTAEEAPATEEAK